MFLLFQENIFVVVPAVGFQGGNFLQLRFNPECFSNDWICNGNDSNDFQSFHVLMCHMSWNRPHVPIFRNAMLNIFQVADSITKTLKLENQPGKSREEKYYKSAQVDIHVHQVENQLSWEPKVPPPKKIAGLIKGLLTIGFHEIGYFT